MMRVVAAADCMLFKNSNPKKKGEEGVELLNVSVLRAVVAGKEIRLELDRNRLLHSPRLALHLCKQPFDFGS